MKRNKPLLLITVLFLFGVKTILACDCRSRGTISEEFQNTTAVFSGKVIAREYQTITDAADKDFGLEVIMVKIKADKWWKGSGDSEVVMRTEVARVNGGIRNNSCDYFFKGEESYLVFAKFYGGWFKTNNCSRTGCSQMQTKS